MSGVVGHPQRGGGVDPVAGPARLAQPRVDLGGVVAALAGNQDVGRGEGLQIAGILDRRGGFADRRRRGASLGRGEEDRVDDLEVALLEHPAHEDGTDHAAPTDDADVHSA